MSKYEFIELDNRQLTVDVSSVSKNDSLWFNATEMAKTFGKLPKDFLRLSSTKEYIDEILLESQEGNSPFDFTFTEDLVRTQHGGKYKGTWMHNELAFEFAGWCSALFRRRLHKWAEQRIGQEHERKQNRLEAKTGYLPMTDAVQRAHDDPKHYHYSNEADMINKIVLGHRAREFKAMHGVECLRDALDAFQLKEINRLQLINTGLIEIGMDYKDRKQALSDRYKQDLLDAA